MMAAMDLDGLLRRLREEEERTAVGWAGALGEEDPAAALREVLRQERSRPHATIKAKVRMEDPQARLLFVTLCKRYGLRVYRGPRQRRGTYMHSRAGGVRAGGLLAAVQCTAPRSWFAPRSTDRCFSSSRSSVALETAGKQRRRGSGTGTRVVHAWRCAGEASDGTRWRGARLQGGLGRRGGQRGVEQGDEIEEAGVGRGLAGAGGDVQLGKPLARRITRPACRRGGQSAWRRRTRVRRCAPRRDAPQGGLGDAPPGVRAARPVMVPLAA